MPRRPGLTFIALCGVVVYAVSACTDPRGLRPAAEEGPSVARHDIQTDARQSLERLYAGTFRPPDATPRPAAKDKHIVFISAGQASASSAAPAEGAMEAVEALGWTGEIYDAQFNPANFGTLLRTAVAAGADGIVANFDCPAARPALEFARERNVPVVPLFGYDCDAEVFGPQRGPGLFASYINYGVGDADLGVFAEGYGAANADAIIDATNGQARVVSFNVSSRSVLYYTNKGFKQRMAECGGCRIVAEVDFTLADINAQLAQRVGAVLAQHPEANAVRSPFTAFNLFGVAPAVVASERLNQLHVSGGEGFREDLDLIRTNKGIDSLTVTDSIWTGWAAVDTLNSLFIGDEPRESGLGTIMIDREHNLPPSGPYAQTIDFRATYRKAWGVR